MKKINNMQHDSISQENKDTTLLDVFSLEFDDCQTSENNDSLNEQVQRQHKPYTSQDEDVVKTVSELECTLKDKDIEIDKLTKLSAKYERQLEKANKYNDDLRHELEVLSSELHVYRTAGRCEMKSVCLQVTDLEIEDAYSNKPMPDWSTDSGQGLGELSIADCLKAAAEAELQNQSKDVTTYSQLESEELKPEAASEYVFDESSGLYYHSGSGYYWDPNSGLFYDYTTGTYYQHNETTGEYEVHSQVELSGQTQMPDSENQKIKNKKQKHRSRTKEGESNDNVTRQLKKRVKLSGSLEAKHAQKIRETQSCNDVVIDEDLDSNSTVHMTKQQDNANMEDHIEDECKEDKMLIDITSDHESELSHSQTSSDSESSSESGELTSESSSSDVEMVEIEHPPIVYESQTEMAEEYPPCIRVIVQSSDHLKCGSLYIITCTGGCVGRDKNKGLAIQIDDNNVSKLHAEITFDYEEQCYTLKDKGSQNGTILNGERLSQNKSESNCCKLHHDDLLQIGSTTFLLHIHKGYETCDSCEPGQVQARIKAANTVKNVYPIMSQEEKRRQRLKELKNIKKKYGLQNSYFESPGSVFTNPDYTDKAHVRRKLVGSESELSKHDAGPASVQSPISAQNKGHKLLAKMGWKHGEGLGKTSSGIAEPITVEMRINQTAGLGSSTDVALSLDDVQHTHKAKRWSQARRRYEQLKDGNNSHTSVSDQLSAVHNSVEVSHSKPLPVPSKELISADSYTPASGNSANSPSLSSSTFTNESMIISEIQSKLLEDSQHVLQASQVQSQQNKPKMTWVKGGTEQIGQFVTPSNLSAGETEDT